MQKLKPVMPSLRERQRYVAFEVLSSIQLDASSVSQAIKNAVLQFVGEHGLAEMGLIMLKETFANNKGVARCSHNTLDTLKASFAFIKDINGHAVTVRSLRASGALHLATKASQS